jgi:hypothetical protein
VARFFPGRGWTPDADYDRYEGGGGTGDVSAPRLALSSCSGRRLGTTPADGEDDAWDLVAYVLSLAGTSSSDTDGAL